MSARLPSRRNPPIGFAHCGVRAHPPENAIDGFQLALQLGATGLESDVWLSSDGHAVLDHDGFVGRGLRRRRIGRVARADLPGSMPLLRDLYTACGSDFELSLDIKDPGAIAEVVAVARDYEAESRLWLCHPDWHLLKTWRSLSPRVHLVDSTKLDRMKEGPERRAATLARAGIDAVNLHQREWSGGLVSLFHRFELFTLGRDAQFERTIGDLLNSGIDGVFSDRTAVMMAAIGGRPTQ